MSLDLAQQRIALVGTGHRGTGMWGKELLSRLGPQVDLVGLCDINGMRAHRSQRDGVPPQQRG